MVRPDHVWEDEIRQRIWSSRTTFGGHLLSCRRRAVVRAAEGSDRSVRGAVHDPGGEARRAGRGQFRRVRHHNGGSVPQGGRGGRQDFAGEAHGRRQHRFAIGLVHMLHLLINLLRVSNFKFLLQTHQKYYITQYGELAFRSLLRWKMVILPILTTLYISLWKVWRTYFLILGTKGLNETIYPTAKAIELLHVGN